MSHDKIPSGPGTHRGETDDRDVAPAASSESMQYQMSQDEGSGRFVMRAGSSSDQLEGHATLEEALTTLGEEENHPDYVVFEHTTTGAARVGRTVALSDNWTAGGRYNRATFFDSEEEAQKYAAERQEKA